eukprot:9736553-Ditylum_brightwellii.AAC.1
MLGGHKVQIKKATGVVPKYLLPHQRTNRFIVFKETLVEEKEEENKGTTGNKMLKHKKQANLGSAIDIKMKEHKDWQQNIEQGKLATQKESAERVQDFAQQDEQDVLDHWEDAVDAEEETPAEKKA